MASVAEQMAGNISLAGFAKATELKKRIWFTLGALVLFRFLSFVPMPGIEAMPYARDATHDAQVTCPLSTVPGRSLSTPSRSSSARSER